MLKWQGFKCFIVLHVHALKGVQAVQLRDL